MLNQDGTYPFFPSILRGVALHVASAETAYPGDEWQPGTLIGHCNAVAYAMQQLFGGKIVKFKVKGPAWYAWQSPRGQVYDFLQPWPYHGPDANYSIVERKTVNPRFKLFHQRLVEGYERAILVNRST